MKLLRIISPASLLFVLVCVQQAAAQPSATAIAENILYRPLTTSSTSILNAEITAFEPLCITIGDGNAEATKKVRFPNLDESTKFKGTQLIAPLTLVAVSTFGTWDKKAKQVNLSIQSGFEKWRGDHRAHFDDYCQYLPAVSYLALGFTGAKSRHNFKERLLALGTSYIAMGIMTNSIKYTVREPRPNNVDEHNSYPSGHTATAFMGAELVRREYGTGYGIAAYVVACGIGVMRIYNNRHWLNDVMAGAGIGILSAQIGYWMLPYTRRLFGMERSKSTDIAMAATPFYDYNTRAIGGGVAIIFN